MSTNTSSSKPKSKPVSALLRDVKDSVTTSESVTVGNLLATFGVRGFAFLMFILALLNVVIFMIPGLSLLFGLPMVILCVQMVLGLRTPLFPSFVRRQTLARSALVQGLGVGIKGLEKVEHLFRPRLWLIAGQHMDRVHGMTALLLAVLMAIPLPLLNFPPSFGLMFLALGIMQRDGFFIVGAYVMAAWSLWLYSSFGTVAHTLAQ